MTEKKSWQKKMQERLEQSNKDKAKMLQRLGLPAPQIWEANDAPLPTAEDFNTVPVRGFRRWSLDFGTDDNGQRWGWLAGCGHREPWDKGVNTAKCKAGRGSEKHSLADCTCGFYAVFDLADQSYSNYPVCGMIEGWGEVVHGPKGFRCEKAKIVALCLPPLKEVGTVRVQVQGEWLVLDVETLPKGVFIRDEGHLTLQEEYNIGLRQAYPVPVFDNIAEMMTEFPSDQGENPVTEDLLGRGGGGYGIGYTTTPAGKGARGTHIHGIVGGGGGAAMSTGTHSNVKYTAAPGTVTPNPVNKCPFCHTLHRATLCPTCGSKPL